MLLIEQLLAKSGTRVPDKFLYTWGSNNNGQIGTTTITTTFSWTVISAGYSHTAAIRSDGILFTWGLNSSGQLGDGTTTNRSSPVQIGSSSWTAVSAGLSYMAAIRSGGTLFTWGDNIFGMLGDGTSEDLPINPVQFKLDPALGPLYLLVLFTLLPFVLMDYYLHGEIMVVAN